MVTPPPPPRTSLMDTPLYKLSINIEIKDNCELWLMIHQLKPIISIRVNDVVYLYAVYFNPKTQSSSCQSFQKRCTIWADFLNQTFFTTIIHFFMLYMPVKSDGQKDNLWPSYEAAKWGQVRFCHAKCDSFHLMVRKCMLFFPWRDFAIMLFSSRRDVRKCQV